MVPATATASVTATSTANGGGAASLSAVHPDVILTHILTRLDGPSLASATCASSHLRSLSTQESLWSDICRATWPSTDHPRMRQLISSFPNGPRSFFSDAFPSVPRHPSPPPETIHHRPLEIVSAVDIHYKKKLVFSKVQETETVSIWFQSSPFRIDLLEPKDVVPTPITGAGKDICEELEDELELTWIIVGPAGCRAANFSSWKPVSVHRHWISGEVQVKFATVLNAGGDGYSPESEMVQCGIVVTFGGDDEKGQVMKEVSFQVEDMEGISLNGKESLGILRRAMESDERRRGGREEWRVRYEEYVKRKGEMKERKLRREVRLDALCTALGVSIFTAFSLFLFFLLN